MRYLVSVIFLFTAFTACKPKVLSGKELDAQLKTTMKNYLDSTLAPGTEVTIVNLEYYVDKPYKEYVCHFTVKLHSARLDTTGIMIATIPNDFSKVKRFQ
ncbi:MAG TPA: hypothetical protein VG847_09145 [Chitinophagaceae bacterium]|nr:hypothetical protein [Chitinophagaceae bacterium]